MEFLKEGIRIIIYLTAAFFVIFSYFSFLWQPNGRKASQKIVGAITVSLIYSFRVIIISSFLFFFFYAVVVYLVPLIVSSF